MSNEVIAALAGALVGVSAAFALNLLANWVWEIHQENTARKRLAVALLSESRTLKDRYNKVFGEYIRELPEGEPLTKFGTIQVQDFFAVYDGNAGNLGLFPPADLEVIIRAYTLAKAQAGTLNNANEMYRSYVQQIGVLVSSNRGNEIAIAQRVLREFQVGAAKMAREESAEMLSAGDEAIGILEAHTSREGWLLRISHWMARIDRRVS